MPSAPTSVIEFSRALAAAFDRGFFGREVHERLPPLDRDSRDLYLYLTLAPALNYQRNSDSFWRAAIDTWNDDETRFVFYPENTYVGEDTYRAALTRHGLALQPTRHVTIWIRIAETLQRDYESDPRVLIEAAGADVDRIRRTLSEKKGDFPYLSGPKLSNYWLYLLDLFTNVAFVDRSEITVVADTHVIGASVRLGLVDPSEADAHTAADAWTLALAGSNIAPCDLHAPLWRWSRAGFPAIDEFTRLGTSAVDASVRAIQ